MGHADRFTPADTSSAQARSSAATTAEHRDHMDATADASHGAVFSRSTGLPARMGKSTAELKTKIPECVKDEFTALAHALGLNESELLRSLVMVRLYGVAGAERMHSNQLRAAAGIGPEWAPIEGVQP
jgi:hypothetical protein